MSAPLAYTVHPGGRLPDGSTQQALAQWLPANGINPNLVAAQFPITVLPVPYESSGDDGPWMIQVIVFHQFYVLETGTKDTNLITRQPVAFQRTVPLRVPFPTEPATDGEDHGEVDREAAQAPPGDIVRDQGKAGVPDRHEGESQSGRGDEAVPEPEEDHPEVQRQEEVGAR